MQKSILLLCLVGLAAAGFVNKDVQRTVDLSGHTARHSLKITASKQGGAANEKYSLAFPADFAGKIAFIEAGDEDGARYPVTVDSPSDAKKGVAYFSVDLGSVSGSKSFSVNFVVTHAYSALPSKIAQADNQKVVYSDNHFFYSPYTTETQKTEVKLSSSNVEQHSEEKPSQQKGKDITYGPYSDKAAYSSSPLRVHFENNAPFFAASSVLKEIEVSMWGNVAVEEHYDIRHTGAELKGFFSRLDMQRSPSGNSPSSIRQFKADLPQGAQDVYYRDVIGNISTSHLRDGDDGPEFEIIPRFPLFGGWKVQFYFGYNLPLHSYLFTDDNGRYHLNVTYGSPIEDIVIDDYTVKIVLPEGSSNFAVNAPFSVGTQSSETRFTYLDRSGRPVIVLHKRNVVSDHDVYFQVTFDFAGLFVWHEPLLLIIGFFALFAVCIVRVRLFDSGDKLSDIVSDLRHQHQARTKIWENVHEQWERTAAGRETVARFKDNLSHALAALSAISGEVKRLESELSNVGPEAAEAIVAAREVSKADTAADEARSAAYSTATPEKPVDVSRFAPKVDAADRAFSRL